MLELFDISCVLSKHRGMPKTEYKTQAILPIVVAGTLKSLMYRKFQHKARLLVSILVFYSEAVRV